jgi:hypothetical protein
MVWYSTLRIGCAYAECVPSMYTTSSINSSDTSNTSNASGASGYSDSSISRNFSTPDRIFVVCRYSPRGNRAGYFSQNVFPLRGGYGWGWGGGGCGCGGPPSIAVRLGHG